MLAAGGLVWATGLASLLATGGMASASPTTGVTGSTINIGMNVPLTGVGLTFGKDPTLEAGLYWKWLAARHVKVDGRSVHMVVKNDQFTASVATQVCSSMATSSYILAGWQGSPVVAACARYANSHGIPYVARGLTPSFGKYHSYFAISPAYTSEADLVARWMRHAMRVPKGSKVMMITYNAATFDALVNAFSKAARAEGLTVVPAQRISYTATQAESQAAALAAKSAGAKVVYVDLGTQLFDVLTTFEDQGYSPKVVTYGVDAEATSFCKVLSGANRTTVYFPSPTPELDYARKHDPSFFAAVKKYLGGAPTDFELYFWWEDQLIQQMLLKAGPTLTRPGFVRDVGSSSISTALSPTIRYRPHDHVTADKEWMLHLDCSTKQLVTVGQVAG